MEFLMDERDQSREGILVALPPFEEQFSDLRFVVGNPDILGSFPLLHRRDPLLTR